jgi:hypothetical protein
MSQSFQWSFRFENSLKALHDTMNRFSIDGLHFVTDRSWIYGVYVAILQSQKRIIQ